MTYFFSYESGNGIKAQEAGKGGPGENQGTQAAGQFSYTGPDGQSYSITYTADEGGFRPQGAHLPTPPPIPPEILKGLAEQGKFNIEFISLSSDEDSSLFAFRVPEIRGIAHQTLKSLQRFQFSDVFIFTSQFSQKITPLKHSKQIIAVIFQVSNYY